MIKRLALLLVLAGLVAGSVIAQRRGWFAATTVAVPANPELNTKRRFDPLLSPVIVGDPLRARPATRVSRPQKPVAVPETLSRSNATGESVFATPLF